MSVAHDTRLDNSSHRGKRKSSYRKVNLKTLSMALSVDKPQAWRRGLDIHGTGIRAFEEARRPMMPEALRAQSRNLTGTR